MNAHGQRQPDTRLSLVHYLTTAQSPVVADCDHDQIDALGNLAPERSDHALIVLAKGFEKHFSVEMRLRLINLMREMRTANRHAGASFLLKLFNRLEGDTALFAREQALQAGAEGNVLKALELWGNAVLVHKDPLAISNVARHMPELTKALPEDLQPRLSGFIDNVLLAAPLIANSKEAFQDIEPRLERLIKALADHGHTRESRAIGKAAIDLKLKWGFSF